MPTKQEQLLFYNGPLFVLPFYRWHYNDSSTLSSSLYPYIIFSSSSSSSSANNDVTLFSNKTLFTSLPPPSHPQMSDYLIRKLCYCTPAWVGASLRGIPIDKKSKICFFLNRMRTLVIFQCSIVRTKHRCVCNDFGKKGIITPLHQKISK